MNRRWMLTPMLGLTAAAAAALVATVDLAEASARLGLTTSARLGLMNVVEQQPSETQPADDGQALAVVEPDPEPEAEPRPVDVVIVLDTSGSMDQLIDSARARLWDIVGEVTRQEPGARLRVGLVTYGSPGRSDAQRGFVSIQRDLTEDLDGLYGQMMELTTGGGEEYVGWAAHSSLEQLSWSHDDGAARLMFIAGNESADQGRETHDVRQVAGLARERGVVINTLFAGSRSDGVRHQWAMVADAAGGRYAAIDAGAGTIQRAAPQDEELQRLNDRLNLTWVPYGTQGEEGLANVLVQDGNAAKMGVGSLGTRVAVKGTRAYDNSSWDLLDAVEQGEVDLATVSEGDLPMALQGLSVGERVEAVENTRRERAALKLKIDVLGKQRRQHLDQLAFEFEDDGLDQAIREAIVEQL